MTAFSDLLAARESEKHLLCHLQPFDPVGAAVVDLYYSTNGFLSTPSDTPANTEYEPRLEGAFNFQRSLFSAGKLSGRSIPGFGSIVLNNRDGGLDALADYAWGGQRVRVWLGGADFALSDYGLIFDGTAEGIDYGDGEISIRLRDLQYQLDREIQADTFAGSGGAEGGADLAGRRKPLTFGICRNVPLIYLGVSGGKHIFSAGQGPIIGVLRVRDLGLELTYNAGTPGAAEWSIDCATGVVTLGGSYVGPITADVIGVRYLSASSTTSWGMATGSKTFTITAGLAIPVGARVRIARTSALGSTWGDGLVTAYSGTSLTVNVTALGATTGTFTDWTISPWGTVAGVVKEIATMLDVASFDTAAFTALDTAQPASVGYYIPEGGNALQHIDAICDGAACHHGFLRAGDYSIGRLALPAAPDSSYGTSELLDDRFERRATDEPNYRVDVRYRRNWAGAMTGNQLAGAVSDADRAFLTQLWRQESDDDADVLTAYPLSQPIIVDGIFDEATDAAAEATRLLAMFGELRGYYVGTFKVQPLTLDLGGTTTIAHNRYGLDAGVAMRRVDIAEDLDANEVEIGLWG